MKTFENLAWEFKYQPEEKQRQIAKMQELTLLQRIFCRGVQEQYYARYMQHYNIVSTKVISRQVNYWFITKYAFTILQK